ncbi:MAG TPA: phenylacetate--CoA ligase family protein [Casimicrobiaceae bacterium]|nr:phenylacetate--CoA ligase family protein [Casimicrobiaceae bacterium]
MDRDSPSRRTRSERHVQGAHRPLASDPTSRPYGRGGHPTAPQAPPPSTGSSSSLQTWWWNLWQTWWSRTTGSRTAAATGLARFQDLVAFAREQSPFYRDLYRELSSTIDGPAGLPAVDKHMLMPRFEEWVTDRSIRRADVDAFLADRSHVGERFLGRYAVWKSSGTTGEPGIYIQDEPALAVYDALIAVQLASVALAARCVQGWMLGGGRAALIAATGDHFASIASWERACRAAPGVAARGFSIMQPLGELVAELNAFAPAFVASYPTMLALLAHERTAGRLRIDPAIVWAGGEFLGPATHERLERAFDCPVVNEYGASEMMSIGVGCRARWLHVNADWVILEPVDAHQRPVPAGTTSHSVLITNLANRVQPIVRYDLGDAVLMKATPCECGNPLPAMRVQGRCDEVVTLAGRDGRAVHLIPLALTTVIEDAIDLHRFQIVRQASDRLALRFDADDAARKRVAFESAREALQDYLGAQGVLHARISLDERAPVVDRSGKLRSVVIENS